MRQRAFIRVVHWVVQTDELGLGDPGIHDLEVREGRIARVNGAGVDYWARAVLRNSARAGGIELEGTLAAGQRFQLSGRSLSELALWVEHDGKTSRFVALAHRSRHLLLQART